MSQGMNYEEILFGLNSLLQSAREGVPMKEPYIDSYVRILDQLAVYLRPEKNRNLVTGYLPDFMTIVEFYLPLEGYHELNMELVRVLANSVADNDANRQIVMDSETLKIVGRILQGNDEELGERCCVLVKNIALGDFDVSFLRAPLLQHIQTWGLCYTTVDLFCDFTKGTTLASQDIRMFIKFMLEAIRLEDAEEVSDMVFSLTMIVEAGIGEAELVDAPILFDVVRGIEGLELDNKLIINRRLLSIIGNMSANTKKQDLDFAFTQLDSSNSYILSSALTIITNSIGSRQDVNSLLEVHPSLVFDVVNMNLTDPIQYQSWLHLLKSLINLMVEYPLETLLQKVKIANDNANFYHNLKPLIEGLLTKVVAVASSSQLTANLSLLEPLLSSMSSCLVLDKLDGKVDTAGLWKKALDVSELSVPHLFQLTKTLGIHFRSASDKDAIATQYTTQLVQIINSIINMKENSDQGSQACVNNGKFFCGFILQLDVPPALKEAAEKLFST